MRIGLSREMVDKLVKQVIELRVGKKWVKVLETNNPTEDVKAVKRILQGEVRVKPASEK